MVSHWVPSLINHWQPVCSDGTFPFASKRRLETFPAVTACSPLELLAEAGEEISNALRILVCYFDS